MRKDNQGFTLVELIIVVAVIAILAGVLAPQYLSYVERARESNDIQLATNLVDAVTIAMADPRSKIPAGQFVEVLWITGTESGTNVEYGSLMIRHPDGKRISIFNDGEGVETPATSGDISALQAFADNVYGILGGEDIKQVYPTKWIQAGYPDAQSAVGGEANLCIHVNSSTGEVALAFLEGSAVNPNRWITMGLDVIAQPDYEIPEP